MAGRLLGMFFVLFIGLSACSLQAEEQADVIGSIKTCEGEVLLIRGEEKIPAKLGTRLLAQDVLRTGKESSVGVVLRDDTTLSLGSESDLEMSQFEFKPSKGVFSMVLNMVKGTLVYVSGRIGKLAPESVQVETPVGVVAVRGTKMLVKIPG